MIRKFLGCSGSWLFDLTAEIKDELEQAAIQSGRSLSQEAELRLNQSFEREFILKSFQAWFKKEMKK